MSPEHPNEFVFPVRIYYEDTDAGGVVFYANYLKFFERARTEWLRYLGINQSALTQETQLAFVVTQTQIQYKRPARLDDVLMIKTRVHKIGKASIDFEQECILDNQVLVQGIIQVCCINLHSFRAQPLPNQLRTTLLSVQDN